MMSPYDPVLVLLEDHDLRSLVPAREVHLEGESADDPVVILEDHEVGWLPGGACGDEDGGIPVVLLDDNQQIDRRIDERALGLEETDPVIVLHDQEFTGLFN